LKKQKINQIYIWLSASHYSFRYVYAYSVVYCLKRFLVSSDCYRCSLFSL